MAYSNRNAISPPPPKTASVAGVPSEAPRPCGPACGGFAAPHLGAQLGVPTRRIVLICPTFLGAQVPATAPRGPLARVVAHACRGSGFRGGMVRFAPASPRRRAWKSRPAPSGTSRAESPSCGGSPACVGSALPGAVATLSRARRHRTHRLSGPHTDFGTHSL